jgi:hypothetical protein
LSHKIICKNDLPIVLPPKPPGVIILIILIQDNIRKLR